MAQVKARQLREKSSDELRQQEEDLRAQIFKLRFQQATGQAENPQKIGLAMKDAAFRSCHASRVPRVMFSAALTRW